MTTGFAFDPGLQLTMEQINNDRIVAKDMIIPSFLNKISRIYLGLNL
jgi:hypothetical protein